MSIDHEATRLAIMARLPVSAWSNPARDVCVPKSGEMLKSTYMTDTQGVLVFEMKYGERPGLRTVVFNADKDGNLHLTANAIADAPKSDVVPERIAILRRVNVLEIPLPAWFRVVDENGKTIADNLTDERWARAIAAGLNEFGARLVTMRGATATDGVMQDA